MKTLILSDLHLGSSASKAHKLLDGLSELARECDHVILNGDTLDRLELPGCHPTAESLLEEVTAACHSRRGPPELLAGNHDPAVSKTCWVYLEDSRTLVFHGDCITDCTHPSKPDDQRLAARMRRKWAEIGGRPLRFLDLIDLYREVQSADLRANPRDAEATSAMEYFLYTFIPPRKAFDVFNYCRRAPRRIATLAATFPKPVANVVVGHSHRPGHWVINGINVYNTGSCMPFSTPYGTMVSESGIIFQPLLKLIRNKCSILGLDSALQPAKLSVD